jgi:MFS family permease
VLPNSSKIHALINLAPYKSLFIDRELRRIVLSSILPRLPAGINGLALTLMVQTLYESFAIGGTVSAAYLVALGVASPLLGRIVDQNGPRSIMVPCGVAHAIAVVVLVYAALQKISPSLLMMFAFAAGLTFPPVSMTVRAMWRKSNFPDATKQLGFALESVIMETIFVCGPLIVSFFLLMKSPASALLFSACVTIVGIVLFARSGALTRWGDVERVERHWLGPLKLVGVRRALIVSLLLGATFGFQELGMLAITKAAGKEHVVGWLFAVYSVPSAIAGLIYGTRQFAWSLNRQMALGHLWLVLLSLALTFTTSLWVFGALCFFCGMAVGPVITASQVQLGKLTPGEYSTEAFTWSMTIFMCALGSAFAIGGWLLETYGTGAAMACATATAALGVLTCLRVPEVYVAVNEAH